MDVVPVTLRGSTVELVPFGAELRAELSKLAFAHRSIFRFMPMRMETEADVEGYLDRFEALGQAGLGLSFATRRLDTGELIGATACVVTDAAHRRLEVGYTWLAPSSQRTRANTEAKYLQFRHAFEVLGCVRVELKTDARNERSRAAMLRIGATCEGTLRSHMINWDGHRRDSVYFSVIDAEWPRVKARLEGMLAREPGA